MTDAARHVTACVCPYKAWGQGVKVQVMRGALNPVTRGDTPLSPFTVGPDERTEIQSGLVTPRCVRGVCVRAHVYSRVCGWLLRTIPFQG